jgi:hypothetical protein
MHTTRSTYLLRRLVGLAAVPTLLLTAAACGDDDDSAGSKDSFCEKARQLDDEFAESETGDSPDINAALAAFGELDPPAEIADDWDTMLGAIQGGEAAFDPTDTEAMAEIEAASEKVNTYMEEECGISG